MSVIDNSTQVRVGMGGITMNDDGNFDSYYHGNPWHDSIGVLVEKNGQPLSVEEVKQKNIIGFDVEKVQNVDPRDPQNLKIDSWGIYKVVPPEKRSAKDFFGHVGVNYTPVQNGEMLDLGNELMKDYVEGGIARLSSVGSLHGGKMCFASFYMPKHTIEIKGDVTQQYLNLVWGHGGLVGINLGVMSFRPECENMVMHAFNEAAKLEEMGGLGLKLKHSSTIHARIEAMKKHVVASIGVMGGLKERFALLAERRIRDTKQLAEIITNVFELKSKSKSEELTEQAKTLIETITGNYVRNINNVNGNLQGTLFQVYQDLTFYLNHQAVSRDTKKANENGYDEAARRQVNLVSPNGTGYKLANRAMTKLVSLAQSN